MPTSHREASGRSVESNPGPSSCEEVVEVVLTTTHHHATRLINLTSESCKDGRLLGAAGLIVSHFMSLCKISYLAVSCSFIFNIQT